MTLLCPEFDGRGFPGLCGKQCIIMCGTDSSLGFLLVLREDTSSCKQMSVLMSIYSHCMAPGFSKSFQAELHVLCSSATGLAALS